MSKVKKISIEVLLGVLTFSICLIPLVTFGIWPSIMAILTIFYALIVSFLSILLGFWPAFFVFGIIFGIYWWIKS